MRRRIGCAPMAGMISCDHKILGGVMVLECDQFKKR
jgi:hypothetical protein